MKQRFQRIRLSGKVISYSILTEVVNVFYQTYGRITSDMVGEIVYAGLSEKSDFAGLRDFLSKWANGEIYMLSSRGEYQRSEILQLIYKVIRKKIW